MGRTGNERTQVEKRDASDFSYGYREARNDNGTRRGGSCAASQGQREMHRPPGRAEAVYHYPSHPSEPASQQPVEPTGGGQASAERPRPTKTRNEAKTPRARLTWKPDGHRSQTAEAAAYRGRRQPPGGETPAAAHPSTQGSPGPRAITSPQGRSSSGREQGDERAIVRVGAAGAPGAPVPAEGKLAIRVSGKRPQPGQAGVDEILRLCESIRQDGSATSREIDTLGFASEAGTKFWHKYPIAVWRPDQDKYAIYRPADTGSALAWKPVRYLNREQWKNAAHSGDFRVPPTPADLMYDIMAADVQGDGQPPPAEIQIVSSGKKPWYNNCVGYMIIIENEFFCSVKRGGSDLASAHGYLQAE